MKIKFLDLNRIHSNLSKKFLIIFKRHLKNSDFILGKELLKFEREFAKYCGTKYCVGVSSGTDALRLSLISLGIKKGDKVIVPDFTFIATATAVVHVGAEPVFCDIEEDTLGINPFDLEKKITSKTKAIVCVHLFGNPCNIKEILKIAKKYDLKVIEDTSQAHGAQVDNKKVGSFGDLGCFSFFPSKNLGALGEAGCIITNKKKLYEHILKLRNCGRNFRNDFTELGFNNRLDTLQAGFLRIKLKYLDKWNQERKRIVSWYKKFLKLKEVKFLPEEKYGTCVYHILSILCKRRNELADFLKKKGIETKIYYEKPLHLQPCFKFLGYKKGDFPISEKISKNILSLPLYPGLRFEEVKFICESIKRFYQ